MFLRMEQNVMYPEISRELLEFVFDPTLTVVEVLSSELVVSQQKQRLFARAITWTAVISDGSKISMQSNRDDGAWLRLLSGSIGVGSIAAAIAYTVRYAAEDNDFSEYYVSLGTLIFVTIPFLIVAVKGVSVTPESQAIRKSGLVFIGSGLAMAVFGLLVSVSVSLITNVGNQVSLN